jgi:hypothetical protein
MRALVEFGSHNMAEHATAIPRAILHAVYYRVVFFTLDLSSIHREHRLAFNE